MADAKLRIINIYIIIMIEIEVTYLIKLSQIIS